MAYTVIPELERLREPDPQESQDINKVSDLKALGDVALVNTKKVRAMQRLQLSLQEQMKGTSDPKILQDLSDQLDQVNTEVAKRQNRSLVLVRQRTALQNKQKEIKRREIEEALRPTTGRLNQRRSQLINALTDFHEDCKKGRKDANDQDQRAVAARLYQWEQQSLTCLSIINKLLPLPKEAE